MIHRAYHPRPPLSDFVEQFWLYEGYHPAHARERLLPTGTTELVINLRDDSLRIGEEEDAGGLRGFRGAVIAGPHSRPFVIDTAQQASVMGVHFRPGGAFPFLGPPAGEFRDLHVSLDDVWGARAGELRERLLEAPTPRAKFLALERALLARARLPLARHPAVAFALGEFRRIPHDRTIADVAGQIGLSRRRFIRAFEDEVGLTPKLFCRVLRFQEVLRIVQEGAEIRWANVALACGYYDQAHLNGDFRDFSGLNPTTYLGLRTEHRNHVPLRD